MTAHQHFCEGDVAKAKDVFENRTLRLTEKTTLRVSDVEGLGPEVARLKTLFQDMEKLDAAWKTYVSTGVSPGFDKELPLFPCNPIPNMKVLVLKGVLDLCHTGPEMLAQIKQLQANSNVAPDKELAAQIKGFEAAIAGKNEDLAALNEAWEAFLPDNKVKHMGRYGYDYCAKEPLIRAYIMDGFAYTCELGTEMLRLIDSLQSAEITPLETITMVKIKELADLTEEYRANGAKIERLWQQFVSQGDKLSKSYQSEDFYCDNIHQVKDWTMQGLSAGCEQSHLYLEQIENFQNTFEFNFTEDLECRVQNLRVKVWDCRYQALQKLASLEAESDAYEQRIQEIMDEYKMGERPEECDF
ncbi:MAG: hypothetical protein R2795_26740 [Saprospiraceae bacterium]